MIRPERPSIVLGFSRRVGVKRHADQFALKRTDMHIDRSAFYASGGCCGHMIGHVFTSCMFDLGLFPLTFSRQIQARGSTASVLLCSVLDLHIHDITTHLS